MKAKSEKYTKTAFTVAFMMGATVISKLLGALRAVFMANAYGTGVEANAFTAAYRIPNTFFDILFSAAIVGCFIPVYNSFTAENSRERGDFARIFLNFILLLTGVLSVIGVVFAREIIALVTPGLPTETAVLAASLLRVLFPSIIFIGAAYTLVGVMQSKGRYLLPAAISSVSNLCVIIYFIFINNRLGENGIYGLTVAYLIAWLAQFLTLAVPLAHSGSVYSPNFDFRNQAFMRALKMLPAIIAGSWLIPVGNLSATYFATYTETDGAVSVFDYSWSIYIIIAGTLVYSLCQYIFPGLARRRAEGDESGFSATVSSGLLSLCALTLPFICGAMILSREGVAVMYMRGIFTPSDAENVTTTLRMLLVAIPAFAVNELFSRVFYSRGDTKLPMLAALAGIAVNLACSAVSVRLLGLGLGAAALSNALGQYASAVVLIVCAAKRLRGVFGFGFLADFGRAVGCVLLSGGVMVLMYAIMPGSAYERGLLANIAVCAVVFVPAGAIYLILLKLSGFGPLRGFTLSRKSG
jgi:integral membrane protein MviN